MTEKDQQLMRAAHRLAQGGKREPRIEIPGDFMRDVQLERLARTLGFQTVNRMLSHVAYEIAGIRTPAKFYRALAKFNEEKASKRFRK